MTIAEIQREIASYNRIRRLEAREKATYDYILGDLIGRSISRVYSSSARYPEIGEVYPSLFDTEEIEKAKQEKKAQLSALRFRQFAQSHNKKYEEVAKEE